MTVQYSNKRKALDKVLLRVFGNGWTNVILREVAESNRLNRIKNGIYKRIDKKTNPVWLNLSTFS